jgi:hypothetical protein
MAFSGFIDTRCKFPPSSCCDNVYVMRHCPGTLPFPRLGVSAHTVAALFADDFLDFPHLAGAAVNRSCQFDDTNRAASSFPANIQWLPFRSLDCLACLAQRRKVFPNA